MDKVLHCKSCGKEISHGKYCVMCKEERSSLIKKVFTRIGIVLTAIAAGIVVIFSIIPTILTAVPVVLAFLGKIFHKNSKD